MLSENSPHLWRKWPPNVKVLLTLAIWIISSYGRCRESVVGQHLLKGELRCNYHLKNKNVSIVHFMLNTNLSDRLSGKLVIVVKLSEEPSPIPFPCPTLPLRFDQLPSLDPIKLV